MGSYQRRADQRRVMVAIAKASTLRYNFAFAVGV